MKSEAHILLEIHLKELGIEFESEYAFHPVRKWRFDYLLKPSAKGCLSASRHTIALEIEGGIFSQGRHTRGQGYLGDIEKYREAAILGFRVLRFSTQEVLNGTAREFIKEHCL